jgi:LysR family transcriptional activator of nhaA
MRDGQLNYRHLLYFATVAKEGHLTRAAARLHLSQSALSTQLRQLEQQLGQPLFRREGRRLQLTEVGSVVLGYAESIFSLGRELVSSVHRGEGQAVQQLRIGTVATVSRNFVGTFLAPLAGREDARLAIESGSLSELLERLVVHRLDVVLSNQAVAAESERRWRCRRIAKQAVCLVGPPRPRKTGFRLSRDLRGVPLALPGPTSEVRTQFDLLCEELGVQPLVHAEIDDMAMLRLFARDAGVLAVVPRIVVRDELRQGTLQQYAAIPRVFEHFYAITTERQRPPGLLRELLAPRRADLDGDAGRA